MPAYDKKRYKSDPEYAKYIKDAQRKHFQKVRFEALQALGMECIKCGNSDYRVLQFDHIEGGGADERRSRSKSYRSRSYATIKLHKEVRDGLRTDIQLLCANCHAIKTREESLNEDFYPEFMGV